MNFIAVLLRWDNLGGMSTSRKLDRVFVAGLDHQGTDRAIVGALIHLAHSLNLTAIAEGVETPTQYDTLTDLGCDLMQGFLWSEPLNAHDIQPFLSLSTARGAPAHTDPLLLAHPPPDPRRTASLPAW